MFFAFEFIAWFWLGFGTWLASNTPELENERREEVEENEEGTRNRVEEWILL